MAVVLCGVNTVGTLGLAAARHLASHGVSEINCDCLFSYNNRVFCHWRRSDCGYWIRWNPLCICLRATSTPTHWNLNLGCTGDFKIQHLQKKRCECDVNERKMPSSYSFTYRRLTGGKVVNRGKDLPGGSVDLIVTAMEDQVHFRRNPAEERRLIFC